MKFKVVATPRFELKLKKDTCIRLQDALDSHNGIYLIETMDDFNVVMRNVKTGKQLVIKSTDNLSRYAFETGTYQFVTEEQHKEPTKQECEKALDAYRAVMTDRSTKSGVSVHDVDMDRIMDTLGRLYGVQVMA